MRRLFPDTYVRADVLDSPRLWARAALVCRPGGVVCGTTAAALWVAEPRDPFWSAADRAGVAEIVERPGPLELLVPGRGARSVTGMRVGRERLNACDVVDLAGEPGPLRLTSPARTVFDVARALPLVEAVVVADAIASRQGVSADDVRAVADRYPGVRGRAGVPAVIALMNRWSTSVRRSRVRLAILAAGLDPPRVAPPICDSAGMSMAALDLAWPALRCGLQVGRDRDEAQRRCRRLFAVGWTVRWVPDDDPLEEVLDRTARMLRRATASARRRPPASGR